MHGAIALARTGRKRKPGQRSISGRLKQVPAINYRALAALQPHRRGLPETLRLSQDAATELGCMYLRGQITEPEYLAGQEYSRRLGQYLATIQGPLAIAGNSTWSGCNPNLCAELERPCECRRKRNEYTELFDVVALSGRRVELAVKRLFVDIGEPSDMDIQLITIGLSALARHLRLTRGRKSFAVQN